jgi:hypothetical protein
MTRQCNVGKRHQKKDKIVNVFLMLSHYSERAKTKKGEKINAFKDYNSSGS